MTTFETNTKVVHNSLVQNLHQRSIISFISNCFFSLDGSSFLKKILHSSIYPLTTPISIFLWKSPEPPWRFVTLIISWLKISMFFSGTNRNCDHSCGWAELWEVLHHTQCWIPHEMEGIVHETDHLNYLHKRSYFQDERIELQNGGNALHLGSNDSLIWTPDLYIYNLKSINIRYLRIVLSLLLFKDNSFFRLFIR